ncbi:putative EthD domain-containing protein [Septoria linicola]|nr:putative EthD domain-containing protein [Septoria linicola]
MSAATVTVVYPQGAKFNMDYYKSTHMPLVQAKWGKYGLKSWKVIKFADDAAYTVQATLEFENIKAFQDAASSPEAKEVLGDVPNFSDKDPVILAGEVQFTS